MVNDVNSVILPLKIGFMILQVIMIILIAYARVTHFWLIFINLGWIYRGFFWLCKDWFSIVQKHRVRTSTFCRNFCGTFICSVLNYRLWSVFKFQINQCTSSPYSHVRCIIANLDDPWPLEHTLAACNWRLDCSCAIFTRNKLDI